MYLTPALRELLLEFCNRGSAQKQDHVPTRWWKEFEYIRIGTIENHGKMARITVEICDNREIHGINNRAPIFKI